MIRASLLVLLTGTGLAALATPAWGQQTAGNDSGQPAQSQSPATVSVDQEAIVVTATKRPQVLIDVPQSISVVSGNTLEAQHASSIQDYLKLVPGLQLDQSRAGEGRLIVRGINTGGVASTVSVYVDETPFGSSTGLVNGAVLAGDFDTFDLSRIEVLRGPQGTLYGASSLGGVLRFVTNEPSLDGIDLRARAGIEDVAHGGVGYSANGVVNVPLGSMAALRVSGNFRKDAGFIDSIGSGDSDLAKDINGTKVYGGRASLLVRPSDKVKLRFSAIVQDIKADAPSVIEANPDTLRPLHGLSQSQFVPQFSNLKYRVYNGTGSVDLGFAELTSATSYGTQKQDERIDFTFALSPLLEFGFGLGPNNFFEAQKTNLKKFTQEVRLAKQGPVVDWIVGGYYDNEKGLIDQNFVAVLPDTLTPIDVEAIFGTGLGSALLNSKYRETAGFANATVHFTPQFDLDFGGRYSHNKQSAHQVSDGLLAGGFTDFPVAHSSESVFTYSVAPKFKPNAHTSLYARVARGFRPGGPNVLPPGAVPADVPTFFHSDSTMNYELGVKAESADRRFSIDAAAFHINWKKIQLFTVVSGFGVNTNGSSARSDGVELTATARPMPGLELSLNGAYTNARLTGPTPPSVGGRKGDKLPFTPKLSLAFNGDYHWQLTSSVRAHVGASYRHVSGQTASYDSDFVLANGRQRHVRPYGVADLFAGVTVGHVDIEAYVKNVGDSRGVTSTTGLTVFGPSPDTGFPLYPDGAIGTGIIRPRTIGMTVGFSY
jgi:iron complex outermembrane receptor protein